MPPGVVQDAPAGAARLAAALVVLLSVVALALLPVAVVTGAVAGPVTVWLGGLAVVVGGVKLAAAAWGLLVERLLDPPRLRAAAAD